MHQVINYTLMKKLHKDQILVLRKGIVVSQVSFYQVIRSTSRTCDVRKLRKRIIEQNLREKLAEEIQTSQWVYDHGGLDKIVPRKELRSEIYNILSILLKVKEKEINNTNDVVSIDEPLQKTSKAV